MNITFLAIGSRGDVQPYIPLAIGLEARGHRVTMATHDIFREFVESHGLEFASLPANPQEVMQGEGGQDWLETGGNPVTTLIEMRKLIEPYFKEMMQACMDACTNADAVIFSMLGYMAAPTIMEVRGIHGMGAYLQPLHPTDEQPFMMLPQAPDIVPQRFYNRTSYKIVNTVNDLIFRRLLNQSRRELYGLDPYPYSFDEFVRLPLPVAYGYSSAVVPRPGDWGAHLRVCGYWFLDDADYSPPPEFADWLQSGEMPVYIGFGSMATRNPRETTDLVVEAVQRSGVRAVLLSGWAEIGNDDLPDAIYKLDHVPHSWLFPKMRAIVHHGGAGTTAAALRSGNPSVVVPHFADQPFWAKRAHAIGAATEPIPRSQLSAEKLTYAIQTAVYDRPLQRRAAEVGAAIQAEDGVQNALDFFEQVVMQQPPVIPHID